MRASIGGEGTQVLRTDRDLSMRTVSSGLPGPDRRHLGVPDVRSARGRHLVGGIGGDQSCRRGADRALRFLFVVVSARVTGEIGSSSNPISGMTVATLLLTCLVFLIFEWTSQKDQLIALSVAAVVCIASSNGGTIAQSLKTGFLVGATPRRQELAIVVGSLSSALVIGLTLLALNYAGTVYSTLPENVPHLKHPLDVSKLPREIGPTERRFTTPGVPPRGRRALAAVKYLINDQGQPAVFVDPGNQRPLEAPGQRHGGDEVPPAPGGVVRPDHAGHSHAKAALGPRRLGRAHRAGDGVMRCPVAAVRGGRVLAVECDRADLRWRSVRYAVERLGHKKGDKPASELESEMSPGALFSTGYIAGGTMGGVLIAFCAISPELTNKMAIWKDVPYQTATALITFAVLAVLLTLVGCGWLLKTKEEKA